MAKYLLLRGGLVLLKTSAHCGTPIFLKANHQLESRMHEICQSGSVGGAKPTLSLPLSPPQKSRPVGYGVIRAGVRTDSMIGVTKFRIRKPKNIGLDSSNLSRPPKLCLATGLWRIQRRYLAGTVHYIEQQLEHHRTRTFQE
jgi:hypothetical protein